MSAYKQFDSKLFDKNDPIARKTLIEHLSKKNFSKVYNNPDKYGPDIVVEKEAGEKTYVEPEIKQNWDREVFPFSTLNIPKRKEKYFNYEGNKEVIFVVISRDLSRAYAVSSRNIKKEYLKEVPNKYISKGEYFYQVPVSECKLIIFGESN